MRESNINRHRRPGADHHRHLSHRTQAIDYHSVRTQACTKRYSIIPGVFSLSPMFCGHDEIDPSHILIITLAVTIKPGGTGSSYTHTRPLEESRTFSMLDVRVHWIVLHCYCYLCHSRTEAYHYSPISYTVPPSVFWCHVRHTPGERHKSSRNH
jgi:hypothetical protein